MKRLVEKFQCPGCVIGSDTDCGKYYYDKTELKCINHVLGTSFGLNNNFALGLPKGFCKPGFDQTGVCFNKINVRLFKRGESPRWDNLNVPVWALEKNGFLFVRTFAPRINTCWVDVIEGGTIDMCKNSIDVKTFYDEID